MRKDYDRNKAVSREMKAAILLALLVPAGMPGVAFGESVYVSRWSQTSVTEGDAIEVTINGWGGSKQDPVRLTVGKDTTEKVLIHSYTAGPSSIIQVHGKNIDFDDTTDKFAVGEGGTIQIGEASTQSLHVGSSLHAWNGGMIQARIGGNMDLGFYTASNSTADLESTGGSIHMAGVSESGGQKGSVTVKARDLTISQGAFFQGVGTLDLEGQEKTQIAANPRTQRALDLELGDYYGTDKPSQISIGSAEGETTIQGTVFLVEENKGKDVTQVHLDGKNVTLTASELLSDNKQSGDYASKYAVFSKGADLVIGNDHSENVLLNGNLNGDSNTITIQGTGKVFINGKKGENRVPETIRLNQGGQLVLGQAHTRETSVTGSMSMTPGSRFYAAGKEVDLDNGNRDLLNAADPKAVSIGADAAGSRSETTTLKGRITLSGLDGDGGSFGIHGKNIQWTEGVGPEKFSSGSYTIEPAVSDVTHDAFVLTNGGKGPVSIGDGDSRVSIDGRLISLNGDFQVDGEDIHLYEGTNRNQFLVISTQNNVSVGSSTTQKLEIDGGVLAMGHHDRLSSWDTAYPNDRVSLQGKDILVDAGTGHAALQANDMKLTAGNADTENLSLNGEAYSAGPHAPIELAGKRLSIRGQGPDTGLLYTTGGRITADAGEYLLDGSRSLWAARSSGGGSITLGRQGSTGVITGNLTADTGSSLEAWLQGSGARLDGQVEDKNLDYGISPDKGITLHLKDGAVWNLEGDSKVTRLLDENGLVHLDPNTTDQKLYLGNFAGDGASVTLGHQGNARVNDRIFVKGFHTGDTRLLLHVPNGKWTDGAIGSVLVSVGKEQGKFYVPEQEDRLFFHQVLLDTHEKSKGDAVTDGYNTDWYLKGFRQRPTDDNGHHTRFVQTMAGLQGLNYQMWREDTDTLFKRMGDLHAQDAAPEGVWARATGIRSQRSGAEGGFTLQHHQYQVGYDRLLGENAKERHYQGIGLGYSRGTGTFYGGTSNLTGISLGLYDTHVKKDGQYWDFVLKGQHLSDEVYGSQGAKVTLDNNGFTAGAEYGWKKNLSGGWFLEPQAQFTLGWLNGASADLANGVRYEENNIHSAVGRAGVRAGYQNARAQFFAKADWFHEFGGSGEIRLADDEGFLKLERDYGDNWFEYGFGLTVQMTSASQFYLEGEKSSTGTYRKKWSWDAGMRWKF